MQQCPREPSPHSNPASQIEPPTANANPETALKSGIGIRKIYRHMILWYMLFQAQFPRVDCFIIDSLNSSLVSSSCLHQKLFRKGKHYGLYTPQTPYPAFQIGANFGIYVTSWLVHQCSRLGAPPTRDWSAYTVQPGCVTTGEVCFAFRAIYFYILNRIVGKVKFLIATEPVNPRSRALSCFSSCPK